jgi:putative tricarboxylic transport membrane protein
MTDRAKDAVLGTILLAVATVWTFGVVATIPPGMGNGDIGPRAFPLGFGLILLALSGILLLKSCTDLPGADEEMIVEDKEVSRNLPIHWGPALILLAEIGLYGFLLEKVGFLIATPVVTLLVMAVNFRVRSLRRLVGMAVGLTFGCWLIFGKILGIYLATGLWINLG